MKKVFVLAALSLMLAGSLLAMNSAKPADCGNCDSCQCTSCECPSCN